MTTMPGDDATVTAHPIPISPTHSFTSEMSTMSPSCPSQHASTSTTFQFASHADVWDIPETPSTIHPEFLFASHSDLLQVPLYNALVQKNNELVAANAKLQRTVGQMEGKLSGKENAYTSLLGTMASAIARGGGGGGSGRVDPPDDPADHVSEEDLQEAQSKGRFWEETSWIPYTQGQELFCQAKKDGVPLYLEDAKGTIINAVRFKEITNAQRRVWQTLKDEGKLPSKWGQRSTYAEDLHRRSMSKFYEFKYCANDYKRRRLATDRYSGWFRTHGKTTASPSGDDSDDEEDQDSPTSPIVARKHSFTMPPPMSSSSHKRHKSSTPATPARASTVQPTTATRRHPSLAPLASPPPAHRRVHSVHHRDNEDEDEDEDDDGGDTELDIPTIQRDFVARSSSLNRPGPNHSTVVRLVDLTDPAKRLELQNKLRKVGDPCAHVPRAPMPVPPSPASDPDSSSSQATARAAGADTGGVDPGATKLRIVKKSNTARNLAAAAYKRLHPNVTTNTFAIHWTSITKPDPADPEYEAKVNEYTLIEARRLFALAHLSSHPAAMVDELLDEFAKLAPEDVTMYCNRVAEAVAKELSKGRGKGKEKA